MHGDAQSTAQRTVGQSIKRSWDCSKIETEAVEEDQVWPKKKQMDMQWAEDENWRKFRNIEGCNDALCKRKSCKRHLNLWCTHANHKAKE